MHEHNLSGADDNCSDDNCPSGKRNRYFKSKYLKAQDFIIEQGYGIERRRLLNRAVLGWGVAYGFHLDNGQKSAGNPAQQLEPAGQHAGRGRLCCGEGLALDRHGRELFRASGGPVHPGEILLLDEKGSPVEKPNGAGKYLLQAHYAERDADKIRIGDSCDCYEWDHVCETIVFSLRPLCRESGCRSYESPCPTCDCPRPHYLPREDQQIEGQQQTEVQACESGAGIDRGPHHCLCEWLTHKDKDIPSGPDHLCKWNGFALALGDAVPLACVRVSFNECGHPLFESIDDACKPRRLVKTNDLLFDLVRGCDLTRIIEVSWEDWYRGCVVWESFEAMFPNRSQLADERKKVGDPNCSPSVRTRFSVIFSGPVQINTLTPECVAMTVLVPQERTGWLEMLRVPVTAIQHGPPGDCDPHDTTREATLCVDADWCDDEIWDRTSIFREKTRVEIEVRGDLILDCHGQAVDANSVGLGATPSGNGTPGGTHISTFRVAAREGEYRAQA